MPARVALALIAVVALGWLGLMERNLRLGERGAAVLRSNVSAGELDRAETDLQRASVLNPDAQPDIDLALVRRAQGDVPGSSAAIESVVRREPDNLVAWVVLGVLARGVDPAASARAIRARSRLDPVNARRARQARPRARPPGA